MRPIFTLFLALFLFGCESNKDKMKKMVKEYNASIEQLKRERLNQPFTYQNTILPGFVLNTFANLTNDTIVSVIFITKDVKKYDENEFKIKLLPNSFISTYKERLKDELLFDNIHLSIIVRNYNKEIISRLLVNKDNIDLHSVSSPADFDNFISAYNSHLPYESEDGIVLTNIKRDNDNNFYQTYEITNKSALMLLQFPELESLAKISVYDAFRPNNESDFISNYKIKDVIVILKDEKKQIIKEISYPKDSIFKKLTNGEKLRNEQLNKFKKQ